MLIALAACTQQPVAVHTSPSILTFPSAAPDPSPVPDQTHVFVIVLENRSAGQVEGTGYIAQLAQQYAMATNYHGVSHPSLPNYLALTSGSTYGVADDGWHNLPAGGLGAELSGAGLDWRAYMESMSGSCYANSGGYALKHDPFAYYGGTCPSEVVPFSAFSGDMKGTVPRFVWITPNLCDDGHDCPNSTVNAWLAQTVPQILATSAWQDGGVLFITWDEGEDTANSVLTLVIRPDQLNHTSAVAYNHYSLLATIEDLLGVPRLGASAQAAPMSDLIAARPQAKLRNRT